MTTNRGHADVTRRLADICGKQFARPAGAADGVAGATARWVAAPGTVEAVTAVLGVAADHDLAVIARGAGTKIDWGATPARLDLVLDTGRLAGVRHRAAGAPVAEVGAGTPVRAVQAILKRSGQRLPLEVSSPGATIGGVLAADESGSLGQRYGSVEDDLLAVRYVSAAGVSTEADQSAGLGSARLFRGSHGALGVLVSATFKVQPIPASRRWVSRPVWTPSEVHDLVRAILGAPLAPAAIEVDLPATGRGAGTLCVLLEGDPIEVTEQTDQLATLLDGDDTRAADVPPQWWRRYPFGPSEVALRIDAPIDHLHAVVYAVRDAAGTPVPVRGSAGLGIVYAALPRAERPDRIAAILDAVRTVLLARQGSCRVIAAPAGLRETVDLWGWQPDAVLLRQRKQRFDPARRLAPGRYFGGL